MATYSTDVKVFTTLYVQARNAKAARRKMLRIAGKGKWIEAPRSIGLEWNDNDEPTAFLSAAMTSDGLTGTIQESY